MFLRRKFLRKLNYAAPFVPRPISKEKVGQATLCEVSVKPRLLKPRAFLSILPKLQRSHFHFWGHQWGGQPALYMQLQQALLQLLLSPAVGKSPLQVLAEQVRGRNRLGCVMGSGGERRGP